MLFLFSHLGRLFLPETEPITLGSNTSNLQATSAPFALEVLTAFLLFYMHFVKHITILNALLIEICFDYFVHCSRSPCEPCSFSGYDDLGKATCEEVPSVCGGTVPGCLCRVLCCLCALLRWVKNVKHEHRMCLVFFTLWSELYLIKSSKWTQMPFEKESQLIFACSVLHTQAYIICVNTQTF